MIPRRVGDGEPVDLTLELDPSTLLLRSVEPGPARVPSKIAPDEMLAFVGETGTVTARMVAERFGVVKNTARATLEGDARPGRVQGREVGDRYFIAGAGQ